MATMKTVAKLLSEEQAAQLRDICRAASEGNLSEFEDRLRTTAQSPEAKSFFLNLDLYFRSAVAETITPAVERRAWEIVGRILLPSVQRIVNVSTADFWAIFTMDTASSSVDASTVIVTRAAILGLLISPDDRDLWKLLDKKVQEVFTTVGTVEI